MKIAYLLESTDLCGGVKVVLRQAEALLKRGLDTVVISPDAYPAWFEGDVHYVQNDPIDADILKRFQGIVGTTTRLVNSVYGYPDFRNRLWHLIQGYEGNLPELAPLQEQIQKAYALPIPKMTISENLAAYLRKIFPEGFFTSIGQGLETKYFYPANPTSTPQDAGVDRLFLIGPLYISVKQIQLGLKAFYKVRQRYPLLKLVRVSSVDTRAEEEKLVGPIAHYHVHASPQEVGRIMRSGSGILFSPSNSNEGFGLPAIEAMASGVPTVLSDIPSFRTYAVPGDYALFVPCNHPDAMAGAVCHLIGNASMRKQLIQRGLEVSSRFAFDKVAAAIEKEFRHGPAR